MHWDFVLDSSDSFPTLFIKIVSLSVKALLFISENLIIQPERLQVFTFCNVPLKGRERKKTMLSYIWLFPLLFIFHDMEEIIGFIPWLNHNQKFLREKYPAIIRQYGQTTSEGFALAVLEELLLCVFICIISLLTSWYGLWIGGFIGCAFHFLIHIGQSIVIRKYVPCLITSIIALPVSVYAIYKSIILLEYSFYQVLFYSFIGISVIAFNLALAHMLMRSFSKYLKRYGNEN